MAAPLFTVIMPVYNARKYLRESIGSVTAQTVSDWEMIIADDASTDGSADEAESIAADDQRISVIRLTENSGGAFRPRLTALQMARGEYIVELDADDYLDTEYLHTLRDALKKHKADIIFGRLIDTDGNDMLVNPVEAGALLTGNEALAASFDGWGVSGMGAVKRTLYTAALERFGMPDTGMCSDEQLTRMVMACSSLVAITDATYYYRENHESVTRNRSLKLFDRIEGGFASLRISNLVGSGEVWKAASMDFFHSFVGLCHIYLQFDFAGEDDRNDTRLRLRNMFEELKAPRFRKVIPLSHKAAMALGFSNYLKLMSRYGKIR